MLILILIRIRIEHEIHKAHVSYFVDCNGKVGLSVDVYSSNRRCARTKSPCLGLHEKYRLPSKDPARILVSTFHCASFDNRIKNVILYMKYRCVSDK